MTNCGSDTEHFGYIPATINNNVINVFQEMTITLHLIS